MRAPEQLVTVGRGRAQPYGVAAPVSGRRATGHAEGPDQLALSRGDVELLRELSRGRGLDAIARATGVSERTVRRRLRRVCDTLGVDTPIEAVVVAVRRRWF